MILGTGAIIGMEEFTRGRLLALVSVLLLCLCALSWGSCYEARSRWGTDNYCGASNISMCNGGTAPIICAAGWYFSYNRVFQIECSGYPAFGYCQLNQICCNSQAEADSVNCAMNPLSDGCKPPDTTWTCTSVTTENGVTRASIQQYVDGTPQGQSTEVLGSCKQNGFCEGEYDSEMLATDSCTYQSIDSKNCNYGGQNGSACYYVCPDGQNYMCRMAQSQGLMQECPTKPWKSCADSINRPKNPNKEYNPSSYNSPADSLSTPSESLGPDATEAQILEAIRDTLHHANEQRKYQTYVEENIYDAVAGYGAFADDGVVQNVRNINSNTRATQLVTGMVAANTGNMVTGINNLVTIMENDTIKAKIYSPESLYVYSSAGPMVFRIDTTLTQQRELMQEIRDLTDTLVGDTPRTLTILQRIVPSIDTSLQRLFDASPAGFIQREAQAFADSMRAKIQPFYDFVELDTASIDEAIAYSDSIANAIAEQVTLEQDTAPPLISWDPPSLGEATREILTGDSTYARLNRWNDSIVAFQDSILQERMKDTVKDTLPLDKVAGDSALIRQKLDKVFLPDEILYECFDFHLNHTFRIQLWNKTYTWDYQILVDFADLFGFDLCDLIRKVVQILTFILIVFTTIKGYIRAFGGGDTL